MHRDLQNPLHKTNLHAHYNVQYPGDSASFFSLAPSVTPLIVPHDPLVHRPLSINNVLGNKLRWVTLGGQYDWTNKTYPETAPPSFPVDIAKLLKTLFPPVTPEAAILNFYSSRDTLSVHRDVSEQSDSGLISVSFGCDGVFVAGLDDREGDSAGTEDEGTARCVAIRLRSGDALLMAGKSRFAWHGVPKILEGTCPDYLRDWPGRPPTYAEQRGQSTAGNDRYRHWRGWMAGKRINLNVRQMMDQSHENRAAGGGHDT